MTNNPPTQHQDMPVYQYEDEISLVDLWLVLVRHRILIVAIIILCTMLGIGYALSKPKIFLYNTTIEIGTRVGSSDLPLVEQPDTLLAKIQETYIPLVRESYLSRNPQVSSVPNIEAKIPKGGKIIVLESKGTKESSNLHTALHEAVVRRVTEDHNRIINILRKESEIQRQQAELKLDELKDDAILIAAREERTSALAKLLSEQADVIRRDLEKATLNRGQSVREVTDESRAMTLLMLDSDIQEMHKRLAEIGERLKIDIPETQDNIAKELADNKRNQENQQNNITKLDIQLANIRETQAIAAPMRSLDPVGTSKRLIVVLTILLGIMLGIFSAFFVEFLARARKQSEQSITS